MPVAPYEAIHRLWDDVASFEAAHCDRALMHLLREGAGFLDAQNAYWMAAIRLSEDERDPLLGWRPRCLEYLTPLPDDATYTRDRLKALNRGATIDEATVAQARLAGTFRARRLCDLVSPGWFESDVYRGYVARGVHDSLTVAVPVSPGAELYYGFLRMRAGDPFTEAHRDLAFAIIRGLGWFHRRVLLSHGLLIARSPLSPMQRRVLALLLTERSEKLIAEELGVSQATIHTYIRDILRKFGVSGRSGLVALWLGRQA